MGESAPPSEHASPELKKKAVEILARARRPQWVDRVADSPFAVPAVGALSFLDACVSPILPEVVLVPLCLSHPKRRFFYALWCSLMSIVGAIVGYWLGFALWENGLREFAYEWVPGFTPEVFTDISTKYGENGALWLFLAAFTPLPFKVFTVTAGVCHDHVDITTLVVASILGRTPRFFLEVELIHRFGPGLVEKLSRPAWAIGAIVVSVALIWLLS